jgi:glycosyltransferase involved in cell wall biosynthesis
MIVIVADRWGDAIGGREQYAADLQRYLDQAGHRSRMTTPDGSIPGDARVLALTPDPRATHFQLHGGLLADAFEAERESYESVLRRALFRPALALNRRRQRLLDLEAALLERAATLMAFCERDAARLRTRGVAAARIVVSRPGVDLARFSPPPVSRTDERAPLRLVFAAHNFVLKGLASAIRAVAAAHRDGVECELTVIGRGRTPRFERLAEQERIAGRVRFAGSLSQAEVAAAFKTAHVLLHPTFHDPFPRVAIEALASGCAVITTARCGVAEVIAAGREGLVVDDPRDIGGLAQAIATAADRSRLATMRAAAAATGRRFDARRHFAEIAHWLSSTSVSA